MAYYTIPKFIKLGRTYINITLVTDFYYDKVQDATFVGIVGESAYRKFVGNVMGDILAEC